MASTQQQDEETERAWSTAASADTAACMQAPVTATLMQVAGVALSTGWGEVAKPLMVLGSRTATVTGSMLCCWRRGHLAGPDESCWQV